MVVGHLQRCLRCIRNRAPLAIDVAQRCQWEAGWRVVRSHVPRWTDRTVEEKAIPYDRQSAAGTQAIGRCPDSVDRPIGRLELSVICLGDLRLRERKHGSAQLVAAALGYHV